MCGILTVTSSESEFRLSSGSPWSAKHEGVLVGCETPSSAVSASKSSLSITPPNASNKLVIRGDRFGDIGDLDLGVESRDSGESPPAFPV